MLLKKKKNLKTNTIIHPWLLHTGTKNSKRTTFKVNSTNAFRINQAKKLEISKNKSEYDEVKKLQRKIPNTIAYQMKSNIKVAKSIVHALKIT